MIETKNKYKVPSGKVTYEEFVNWRVEVCGKTEYNTELMDRNWTLTSVGLTEEDYVAFRLRFGV
jgi:hypothetical protein